MEETQFLLGCVMRMGNLVTSALLSDDPFSPLLSFDGQRYKPKKLTKEQKANLPLWCKGYIMGMSVDFEVWEREGGEDMVKATFPILTLASDTNYEEFKKAFISSPSPSEIDKFKRKFAATLPQLIRWIYQYWREHPIMESASPQRNSTKIGRNEPCPCGSGKKFKKCCGGSSRIVH